MCACVCAFTPQPGRVRRVSRPTNRGAMTLLDSAIARPTSMDDVAGRDATAWASFLRALGSCKSTHTQPTVSISRVIKPVTVSLQSGCAGNNSHAVRPATVTL